MLHAGKKFLACPLAPLLDKTSYWEALSKNHFNGLVLLKVCEIWSTTIKLKSKGDYKDHVATIDWL